MKNIDVFEAGKIAIKGITAMIPTLGGALNSVWSDIEAVQARRKQERLEVFYIALREDMKVIKDQINRSYINQSDFLDVFELTARYIVNERTEKKRILFKNIFIKSITQCDCSYDKTEKYLRILGQMNQLEIFILKVLLDPVKYNTQQGETIKDPNWIKPGVQNGVQTTATYYFIEVLSQLIKISEDDVLESIYFLAENRLVARGAREAKLRTNGHPINILDNTLTPKGVDFISFILQ